VASNKEVAGHATSIWYIYPMWKHVSWTPISEKHIQQLQRHLRVHRIDELALPILAIATRPLIILHPYFYPMTKFERKVARIRQKMHALIGIDVADSDRISEYAVRLTEHADAIILPSNFAKKAYTESGVKTDVHVIPHGVDPEWIDMPSQKPARFKHLADLKKRRNLKIVHAWIPHSPYRKGLDILLKTYARILEEYNNALLVIKTFWGVGYFLETIEKMPKPTTHENTEKTYYQITHSLKGYVDKGWLNESEKMELFDLCDLFILSSRGGGFEHPALEALARGIPIIAARGASWEDYLPPWSLVESHESGKVFLDNPIHVGKGVEMNIEEAAKKAVEILENNKEYKAKAKEHAQTTIKKELTWEKVGVRLKNTLLKYL